MATIDFVEGALLGQGIPRETVQQVLDNFRENPKVWRAFEKFTLDAIRCGKKIGAKAVMERVRWEFEIEKNHWADAEYKINNSWVAYYARIFAIKFPEHRDYFDFREVRGVTEQ